MVAFLPVCKRERAVAASQAVTMGGGSALGVGVSSITGVPVGVGSGVAVGAGRGVSVRESVFVAVGEGRGVSVGASGFVAVGEGREVGVGAPTLVALGAERELVSVGSIVSVGDGRVAEVDTMTGFAVPVGDERGVAVMADSPVVVRSSSGCRVGVGETDAGVVRIVVESALSVADGIEETNAVGENVVGAGSRA